MAKASILILKVAMILISMGWISVWLLKPTQLWTRKWKAAEKSAPTTIFGYNGTILVLVRVFMKWSEADIYFSFSRLYIKKDI